MNKTVTPDFDFDSTHIDEERKPLFPKIVGPDFKPFWKEDVPMDLYHADKTSLSSSGVKRAIKSAANFKTYWTQEPTDEDEKLNFRIGSLAHVAILEPKRFMENYVIRPVFKAPTLQGELSENSKAAKKAREQWEAKTKLEKPGVIIISNEEYDQLAGMVQAIVDHPDARAALSNGKPEMSGYYRDAETGLFCRIRPDFLSFNGKVMVDLKTTRDCEAWSFARDCYTMKYYISMAMYAAGCEAITGQKVRFPTFIAVEKTPPYDVAVYVLDDAAMDLGTGMYRRGLRRVKEAISSGKWEKYQTQSQNLALPGFAFYDDSLAVN